MGSDRICHHTVAKSTASLLLVAGSTIDKHMHFFLLLCWSYCACQMRPVVALTRTSTMPALASLLHRRPCFSGSTAIFADTAGSHRSPSAFFYSQTKSEKRSSACHCSTSLFTYQWELQWVRAPGYEEAPVAESPTMNASDADCACFSDSE